MNAPLQTGCSEGELARLWSAVRNIAELWRQSNVVMRWAPHFVDPMRATPTSFTSSITELSNYTLVRAPLMPATMLRTAMQAPIAYHLSDLTSSQEWKQLVLDSEIVEDAFFRMLTFARSRIPGYPILRVPQTARDSELTSRELGFRAPWLREHFDLALQKQRVSSAGPLLGLDPDIYGRAEVEFTSALQGLTLWRKFGESRKSLNANHIAILSGARRRLAAQLKDIDQFEPSLNVPRYEYRLDRTNQIVDALPDGPAHTHAELFRQIDRLIDLAMVTVFGHLVLYEAPIWVESYSEFAQDESEVNFTTKGWIGTGWLIRIPNCPEPNSVLVKSVTVSFGGGIEQTDVAGEILDGTYRAWSI